MAKVSIIIEDKDNNKLSILIESDPPIQVNENYFEENSNAQQYALAALDFIMDLAQEESDEVDVEAMDIIKKDDKEQMH